MLAYVEFFSYFCTLKKKKVMANQKKIIHSVQGESQNESNIIIYNTIDGKASVVLYARDGSVWMN